MLGEFFAAESQETGSLVEDGPFETRPIVEAKGLDEVSLATLGEIIEVGSYGDLVARIGPGVQGESGCNGILPLPDAFRDALTTANVEETAERWAATDELAMDGWQPSDAAEVLRDLSELARQAQAEGRQLFYWWSV